MRGNLEPPNGFIPQAAPLHTTQIVTASTPSFNEEDNEAV